ncbi:MFS family permease [Halarchaeum rubridurum]|uniref:MFS family permease n=1 Tax=Halarchaeum rubridurum TaxID=489911 RepID=A0A8T4GM40_9EURY|nr:MFS transporter [Halarchaeum rubridurum]MBP1953719.1 MFS family permease [Halarchaeum rubridurum]
MSPLSTLRRFRPGVLAAAFATYVVFLGIGVVDPVLPTIAAAMGASHTMVELLFTSYILVMAIAMLFSGPIATRLGDKRTMTVGVGLVVVFAGLCGLAPSIDALALLRGGWGLGNALFTTTVLAIIVGLSRGDTASSITLFEGALGMGIASGPLIGGFLGSLSWRYPFFAASALAAVGLLITIFTVESPEGEEHDQSVRDVLGALRHPAVLGNALVGLLYTFGFFVVLAYTPLTLDIGAIGLGLVFFGWGAMLALGSVAVSSRLVSRYGAVTTIGGTLAGFIVVLAAMGVAGPTARLALVVVSGLFCGISNAVLTTLAIEVSPFSRSISSASYNCLRWSGAAFAPIISGYLGGHYGTTVPFFLGALVVALAVGGLLVSGGTLRTAVSAPESAGTD